ncbi:hypothetical protein AB0G35_15335 [Streptomyces sp. NPDC021749]|uniref:hypothetical protein n=1 Tax=Streptomyces sp. NPDC021749 TaxID=3154905 RepID=UPI0033E92068
MNITVTQTNPLTLTLPHVVTNPVIKPVMQGDFLEEIQLTTTIHEFLFKVTKDNRVFWVGVAVPFGTIDFSRIQVFFHPTVVQLRPPPQPPVIHAAEADYPTFTGGWSGRLQRYVALQGGQLASVRRVPLLVPFTTMAALGVDPQQNMFSIDPVATLSNITAATQAALLPFLPPPNLTDVGVTSFSSGIQAMRKFIAAMKPSGFIREVIDFDSPFITTEPAELTPSPGAVSSCYTQRARQNPPSGYRFMPADSFSHVPSHPDPDPGTHAHACIGFMMYHTAMITSSITAASDLPLPH